MKNLLVTIFLMLAPAFCLPASPDTQSALIDAVASLQVKSKVPGALASLRDLAASAPDNDAVYFFLGKAELLSGNITAAVKAYEEAARLDPGNDEYKETLAQMYSSSGRNAESAAIYLDLLERKPSKYRTAYTLTLLGDKHLTSRKDSLAMECYNMALLYDPDYMPAVLGKSEIFRMHGNLAAFFVLTDKFASDRNISAQPKCDYIRNVLKRVDAPTFRLWGAQIDSVVSHCVAAHPTDSSALGLAGWWFYGTGRAEKGKKCLEAYVANYPDALESHWIRLDLLNDAGDTDAMIKECNAILDNPALTDSKRVRVFSLLGDCLHEKGKEKDCFKAYDKALSIDPDYAPVLNNYAYFLCLKKKKLSKALEMSKKTVDSNPDNPTYLDTYGWLLHTLGRDEEAKPFFKHALLYGGKDNDELLLHYAEILDSLGEKDLASYYRTVVETRK